MKLISSSLSSIIAVPPTIFPVSANDFTATHAIDPLVIPTSDGTGATVHPGVFYAANGWNGYKYWMVHTPYYNSTGIKENPEICASNDGINWEVPIGTNPIPLYPAPIHPLHNSDPEIFLGYDNKLYTIYNAADYIEPCYPDGKTAWAISGSSDGITWNDGNKGIMVNNFYNDCTGSFSGFSPSVVKEEATQEYVAYGVRTQDRTLRQFRSFDPYFQDTDYPSDYCIMVNFPAGRELWHPQIIKENGQYIGFFCLDNGVSGTDTQMWMAVSPDGYTWTFADQALLLPTHNQTWDDNKIYKGSAVYFNAPIPHYKLWYSAYSTYFYGHWNIGVTTVNISL